MDCDQVFVVLTRGPVGQWGAERHEVEAHLGSCASCREFAEALRPAPETQHESLGETGASELPRYGSQPTDPRRPAAPTERATTSAQRPRIYRRGLTTPARRTWTASREVQEAAPPAVVEERAGTGEWLLAICLLGLSAAGVLTLLVWAVASVVGWFRG